MSSGSRFSVRIDGIWSPGVEQESLIAENCQRQEVADVRCSNGTGWQSGLFRRRPAHPFRSDNRFAYGTWPAGEKPSNWRAMKYG